MVGKVLSNRYELLSKIGNGGMAVVYKAKCNLLNRYVAVKVLRKDYMNDKDFIKRFKIESQSAAKLSHPNIVSVYDVGQDDDIHYIVMEYIDGITLKKYINDRRKIGWRETVDIAKQISQAIKKAHENQIVHRDIKPHNVLMTKDGIIKVADFGIAKAITNTTVTVVGSTMGSVHYFSPEQAKGDFVGIKSDLYSLGITMYEMVTGRVPFDADSAVAIALKHINQKPIPPRDLDRSIPKGINDIILKAMRKEQNSRYQKAAEIIYDLEKVSEQPERNLGGNALFKSNSDVKKQNFVNKNQEENILYKLIVNYNISGLIKKISKKINKKILIASGIIFLVVISIIIGTFVFNGNKVDDKNYKVGNYIGKDYREVIKQLKKDGWKEQFIYYFESESNKKNLQEHSVVDQYPKKGEFIKINKGKVLLYYVINKKIKIPDVVVGEDYKNVKKKLESMGFINIVVYSEESDMKKGAVVRIEPIEGSKINKNTDIIIYYSRGKMNNYVRIPNLIGLTYKAAKNKILSLNLTIGNVIPDNISEDYIVKYQNPEHGASIKIGSRINLELEENKPIETSIVKSVIPTTNPTSNPISVGSYIDISKSWFNGVEAPYDLAVSYASSGSSGRKASASWTYNLLEQIPEREYLSNLVSGETYKRVITVNGNIVDNRVVTIN